MAQPKDETCGFCKKPCGNDWCVTKRKTKDNMEEMITITKKDYEEMLESLQLLAALQAAGVDNWEGYDCALELMDEMAEE